MPSPEVRQNHEAEAKRLMSEILAKDFIGKYGTLIGNEKVDKMKFHFRKANIKRPTMRKTTEIRLLAKIEQLQKNLDIEWLEYEAACEETREYNQAMKAKKKKCRAMPFADDLKTKMERIELVKILINMGSIETAALQLAKIT